MSILKNTFLVHIEYLTNNFHHFHYRNLSINYTGLFPVAETTKGFWYYIDYIYKNILIFSGTLLFFRMIGKTTGYHRKQAIIIFSGLLIPWLGNIMALLGISPYGIDTNPFYLAFAVPIFGYAMFRLRMFDIAPIARDRIFEEMRDPVIVLDRQNRIADYNTTAENLLPELRKDITGLFIHDVLIDYSTFINKIISPDKKKREVEFNRDGIAGFYSVSTTKLFSKTSRHIDFIIELHNITEHKNLLEKLHKMASIDALTQIYNRRFFMELSLNEMKRMNRYQGSLSMLMIDIDFFKKVNDTYGHPAGDLILKNTAASFKIILRDSDIPGRYGGEEFTILLPETDASGAASIAERLREDVSSFENIYKGVKINITVSIGISHIKFDTPSDKNDYVKILDSLLCESDQALYQAKEQGRNQVQTYIRP
ncbi:MAG: diguanylate cyclase [Spirochaetaceae bacterium]|nr:diguanylate cyclase [Spirochaetaceae bacterium]